MSTAEFPIRLPEKLKAIRERLGMTPDQLAPFVGEGTERISSRMRMTKMIATFDGRSANLSIEFETEGRCRAILAQALTSLPAFMQIRMHIVGRLSM